MAKVFVVDTGVVNLRNILRGLQKVGADPVVSTDADEISAAEKIVLPGVGAFEAAMQTLRRSCVDEAISSAANSGSQVLGICLGMQLVMEVSEENGIHSGLGLIPGRVVPIPSRDDRTGELVRRVPNIGWRALTATETYPRWEKTVLEGLPYGCHCYFVHSYMAKVRDASAIVAHADYAGVPVVAAIAKENITGVQFHPERSAEWGLAILRNFIRS